MLFAAHEVAQSKAVHFHEDKPRYLTGPHGHPDSRSPNAGCCYAWASPKVVDSSKVAVLPASKGPVRPNEQPCPSAKNLRSCRATTEPAMTNGIQSLGRTWSRLCQCFHPRDFRTLSLPPTNPICWALCLIQCLPARVETAGVKVKERCDDQKNPICLHGQHLPFTGWRSSDAEVCRGVPRRC